MTRKTYAFAALAAILLAFVSPTAASAESTAETANACVPFRPEKGFYEAGRVGSEQLTTPTSGCTTISVSNVRDPANPTDRCQTFLVGYWPVIDGSLSYTEPVTACSPGRTVVARNMPDNTQYIVIYTIDYFEQNVDFRVWH